MDINVKKLEKELWDAANELRISNVTSSEYSMAILGIIFLKYATLRFNVVNTQLAGQTTRRGEALTEEALVRKFKANNALYLPEEARYDYLVNLPESTDIGIKINTAIKIIEELHPELLGTIDKIYSSISEKHNQILFSLLKKFDSDIINQSNGDIFGRIYEFFLNEFAKQGAQDDGAFFTPVSIVELIVNFIEPTKGKILDPACGSGGMFVQSSHFIETHFGKDKVSENVTFYGQELKDPNAKLARMNLAVHGLEGKIIIEDTFKKDAHELVGGCDYVMANPPFNVSNVLESNIKTDDRLLITEVTDKKGNVESKRMYPSATKGVLGNANYLWIQYFLTYLNDKGRAGFVMASGAEASTSNKNELEIRKSIIEQNVVDVIVGVRKDFFYTLSVPCTLWFYDKNKKENIKDKILMIKADDIWTRVPGTQNKNMFSEEQIKNLTAIVNLYRSEEEKYFEVLDYYFAEINTRLKSIEMIFNPFEVVEKELFESINTFISDKNDNNIDKIVEEINKYNSLKKEAKELQSKIEKIEFKANDNDYVNLLLELEHSMKDINKFRKDLFTSYTTLKHIVEYVDKEIDTKGDKLWKSQANKQLIKRLEELKETTFDEFKRINYFEANIKWLVDKFGNGKIDNIIGLCAVVDKKVVEENKYSLNPGIYVGVEEKKDDGVNFEERMKEIKEELKELYESSLILHKDLFDSLEDLF